MPKILRNSRAGIGWPKKLLYVTHFFIRNDKTASSTSFLIFTPFLGMEPPPHLPGGTYNETLGTVFWQLKNFGMGGPSYVGGGLLSHYETWGHLVHFSIYIPSIVIFEQFGEMIMPKSKNFGAWGAIILIFMMIMVHHIGLWCLISVISQLPIQI